MDGSQVGSVGWSELGQDLVTINEIRAIDNTFGSPQLWGKVCPSHYEQLKNSFSFRVRLEQVMLGDVR